MKRNNYYFNLNNRKQKDITQVTAYMTDKLERGVIE